jgi:hypothetical protein
VELQYKATSRRRSAGGFIRTPGQVMKLLLKKNVDADASTKCLHWKPSGKNLIFSTIIPPELEYGDRLKLATRRRQEQEGKMRLTFYPEL